MGKAFALYTLLRFGLFGFGFLAAAAIVLPSTSGPTGSRLLICALIGLVVSVPLALVLGRRIRDRLTAALLESKRLREEQDREYDARVAAARTARRG